MVERIYTPADLRQFLKDYYPNSFRESKGVDVDTWFDAIDTMDTAEELFIRVCSDLKIRIPDGMQSYLVMYFSDIICVLKRVE